ncbi:MAG: ribonuclease P protein component 4, partial [Candidatus Aenigmatarchaeota archaeon]
IARERIEILFREAEKRFPEQKQLSNRYVELAKRIGERYRVRIPRELKRKYCRHCNSYIKPGINCEVEMDNENKCMVYKCGECGKKFRYDYSKK